MSFCFNTEVSFQCANLQLFPSISTVQMLVAKVIYLLYSVIFLPEICNKTFCEEIHCHCVAYNTDRQTDTQSEDLQSIVSFRLHMAHRCGLYFRFKAAGLITKKDIQGEHKVFPWLQTLIKRKLRGINTYFFFLPLLELVSKILCRVQFEKKNMFVFHVQ